MLDLFKKWFKQPSSTKSRSMRRSDQRRFDRYPIEFPVIIAGSDIHGRHYEEETILHDISGAGAMFMTFRPEKYYPGQLLKITILLAGTNEVSARVLAEASVVRIQRQSGALGGSSGGKTGIAVRFDRSFEFERIGYNLSGQR